MGYRRALSSSVISLALATGTFPFSASALTIEAGSFKEDVPGELSTEWFSIGTKLAPISATRSEIENIFSCEMSPPCAWSLSRRSQETASIRLINETNPDAIRSYAVALASKVNHGPKNARFGEGVDGSIVATEESEDGTNIDESSTVSAIEEAIRSGSSVAHIPVRVEKPEITSDDLETLGIREVIAEGVTNFAGSPKNRIHNIKRALQQFQGIIVRPNEEFSFVSHLGEVDGEHGYLPELVIKYNKTEPEFGGGICQVSSTVFRAAVNAGFKITARKNHAYPVRYYKPYGMDATIYIPNPDLRFINNSGNAILILSSVEGTKLTFRFYGTKDGRSVEIDGPHILESNPDGSMKTVFSQKVTDASGNVIISDSFPSHYKSPDLYPHFEILTEKPKEWTKKQWEEYLVQKADYEAKLRAAYATIPKNDTSQEN